MFAIHDIQGPQFQGTLEQLYKVHPVLPTHHAKFSLHQDTDETVRDEMRSPAGKQAEQAYRRILNMEQTRMPLYHVHQIMQRKFVSIPPEMWLRDAWSKLQKHHVKQLPVLTGDNQVIGLLSESNLLRRIIVTGEGDLLQVPMDPVSDVMRSPVITADPMTDIRRIARVMADYKFQAVPVTDPDKGMIGIVTRGDILRKFANTPPLQLWS